MAALKVILIALLATFAVQGVAAGDSFETSINTLSNLTDQAITGLTKTLGAVVDNVSADANEAVDSVKGYFNGLFSKIGDLEKKALDLGVDVSKCISLNKAILAETEASAVAAIRACEDSGVEAAKAAMQNGIAQLPDLKSKIDELNEEWNACSIWNLICYSKVIAMAGLATVQAGLEISALTTEVALQFEPIIYQAGNCTASILPDVTRNATTIMNNVFECTKNIIPVAS